MEVKINVALLRCLFVSVLLEGGGWELKSVKHEKIHSQEEGPNLKKVKDLSLLSIISKQNGIYC